MLDTILQQLITGISNGMIIALIALGYTMVYGIIELINFAHGDLFMLGSFFALSILAIIGVNIDVESSYSAALILLTVTPIFCAILNYLTYLVAYRPLRGRGKMAPLVSAIGVSFIFVNFGLFWGGLPLELFDGGTMAAAAKNFPSLIPNTNILSEDSSLYISIKEVLIPLITLPLMLILFLFIKYTSLGKAMRAQAQDPLAASLMGINNDKIVGLTFAIGGALAGIAGVTYALYNNTISYQMGYRVGIDAFTAAVLGGIGSFFGAVIGGVIIGIVRAFSDQYVATQWTTSIVFAVLIMTLIFKPSGLLGSNTKEKV